MFLIAKSKEKESKAEDGVIWWKEYRLSKNICHDDYQVEMRYMCRKDGEVYARIDGSVALFTDPDTAWERWGCGLTPEMAINDVIGDTDFYEAASCHTLHAAAVMRVRRESEQRKIRQKAEEFYRQTVNNLKEWEREQNRLFNKRHGHKSGEDFQKAKDRTLKRLRQEYVRLKNVADEAKAALLMLQ